MKKKKLRTETTETIERWVISRQPQTRSKPLCGSCGDGSILLSLAEACGSSSLSAAEICTRLATGQVHGAQTFEGHILICGTSLTSFTKRLLTTLEIENEQNEANKQILAD